MLLGSPSLCDLYVVCPLSAHVHDEQLTEKVIVVHMLLDLRVMCFLPMADMLKKKKKSRIGLLTIKEGEITECMCVNVNILYTNK